MSGVYRTPDERFAGLPDWPFEPRYADVDGLRVHHVDEGEGDPVLLLHGEPTWSFMYRHVIPRLLPVARVVAPDHAGFGRSDKPLDPGWYSYDRHFHVLERLVEQLDLRRVTLVVHDWGGPLGFRLAVEQPERVARLVALNTGIGAGRAPSEAWLRFREVVRRAGGEFSPGRLIARSCTSRPAPQVVAAYDAPFPTPESKAGPLAFPELVPTEPGHPSAAAMLDVRARLARWDRPALVLFGADDLVFPPAAAERLAVLLSATAETIPGAGHFVAEERGAEVGERVAAFLSTT